MNIRKILIVASTLFCSSSLFAQEFNEKEVINAAGDELTRSMQGLALPGYPKPFFISYAIGNMSNVRISATRGAIVAYNETPSSNSASVRLMIGDYNKSSEVMYGEPIAVLGLPMEASGDAVKRALWNMSDASYREALNMYGRKMSFLEQSPRVGKLKDITDFEQVATTSYVPESTPREIVETKQIKEALRQLSAIFSNYAEIGNSSVQFENLNYTAYQLTSEGTLTKTPHTITNLTANAAMTMDNGNVLTDMMKITVANISDMPTLDEMKKSITTFIENFIALSKAEYAKEKYKGPVLFDNSTYSVYLNGALLSPGALIAMRPQEGQQLGDVFSTKIGESILDERLSVKNYSSLKEYNGKKLMGSYDVDADGITPQAEMLLVSGGKIAGVINGRIPTAGAEKSTGSARWVIGSTPMTKVAPGTIHYQANGTIKDNTMKKQLIKIAKKEKREYAYIIKRVSATASLIYRVNVNTEEETLIRGMQLPLLDIDTFKNDVLYISDEERVTNALSPLNTLISFITPKSMIIDDVALSVAPEATPRAIYLTTPSKR